MGTRLVMSKFVIVLCCVAGAGLLLLSPPSVSAATVELKFAHVDPADIWTSRKGVGRPSSSKLSRPTVGEQLKVKVFPAGQLGGEREVVEAVKLGSAQMTMVSGAFANYYKEYQLLDTPYCFLPTCGMGKCWTVGSEKRWQRTA